MTDGVVASMMFLGALPREESLGTIWQDYWGKANEKTDFRCLKIAVGVTYHKLHHFLTEAPWSVEEINERRLQVMASCRQTKIASGFTLIVDDSGHRKSGTLTSGVGRQYIGEIGKTENGRVIVTTHLDDGVKSLPLDVELYQHASSLALGKLDQEFVKKPDLAMNLMEKCLKRGDRPKIVLIDSSYGNNRHFVQQLEAKKLKYIVGVAKNRRIFLESDSGEAKVKASLDEVAKSLKPEAFTKLTLSDEKPRTVWLATFSAQTIGKTGERVFAIAMNTPTLTEKTEVDYFMTNVSNSLATAQWFVQTYSQRNALGSFLPLKRSGWLGLSEYQVRDKISLERHGILVFTAYTFIQGASVNWRI